MILAKELTGESYLSLAENCDYMTNWLNVYKKYAEIMKDNIVRLSTTDLPSLDKADLRNKTDELNVNLEYLRKKLNVNRKMRETQIMTEVHKARRHSFSAIRSFIEGHRQSMVEEEKEAATILADAIGNFKISKVSTYAGMSTMLTSCISVLRSEKYFEHVKTLGMEGHVDKLEEDNNQYISLYQQRNILKQEMGIPASKLYEDCYRYFNSLIRYLNGILTFYVHQEFANFVAELNGITFTYQVIVNGRKASAKRNKLSGSSKKVKMQENPLPEMENNLQLQ